VDSTFDSTSVRRLQNSLRDFSILSRSLATIARQQESSLVKIFGGRAGGHPATLASFIGKMLGVKKVPVNFTQKGKEFTVQVPNIVDLTTEPLRGAGGADVQISGHPLCIAPGFPVTVSRSNTLKYTDHGMTWNLTRKNAFFSPFAYHD